MRAMRFRAWDKISKKFLYPWPNGFSILGETTCFDLIGIQLKERSPEKTTLEMLNDVVIMQFTGCFDCYGKEIYEGDICEFEIHNGTMRGIIGYSTELAAFYMDYTQTLKDMKYKADLLSAIGGSALTVIGNVYENKELLP